MLTLQQRPTKSVRDVEVEEVQIPPAPVKPVKLLGPVVIRNMQSVRYVYQGMIQRYDFPPAGTLPVDRKDVPILLAKLTRGGGCCGYVDPGGRQLFTEV